MTLLQKCFLALSLVFGFSHLEAAFDLGRGYLFTDVSFSSEYTSNSQAADNGESDWINTLTPALRYESYGSEWRTNASLGVSLLSYSTQDQDNENINFSASLSHPRGFSVRGGVSESTGGDPEFGQITRTRNYNLSSSFSYGLSPRYPLSSGFTYSLSQPLDDSNSIGRSDTESFSIPINVSYRYSENLNLGGGYRFEVQQSDASQNASDSTNHSIFASASGKILPLVSADLSLGGQMRQDDEGDDFGPYASGGLSWQASSLTTVGLNLSAGFQTTTGNRNSRNISISTRLSHRFPRNVGGSLSAGISSNEYSDVGGSGSTVRTDTSWNLGAGLGTTIYEHTSLSLSVSYQRNNSDQTNSDFDSYGIRFSASRTF